MQEVSPWRIFTGKYSPGGECIILPPHENVSPHVDLAPLLKFLDPLCKWQYVCHCDDYVNLYGL